MIEIIGKLVTAYKDMVDGDLRLVFASESNFNEDIEEILKWDKIRLRIEKYKAKRSLDANAYYWTLLTKLAKVLKTSNAELHNLMLSRYGQPWIVGDALHLAMLPDSEKTETIVKQSVEYHLRATSQVTTLADGKAYRTYITMRGSSTYNTEEMATLLDGLISECKAVGMTDGEIMTPEEKRILEERYGVKYG
jgi:hypothetical protein